ncbi:hypothetical protein ACFSTC_57445 [Nonomuraea ferruginea]
MADDPWSGTQRVNFLLIGADSAPNRPGVRTDSMTVASVDTATGATTLLGLPRNLEEVPMPAGPARARFPYGFTGDGLDSPACSTRSSSTPRTIRRSCRVCRTGSAARPC